MENRVGWKLAFRLKGRFKSDLAAPARDNREINLNGNAGWSGVSLAKATREPVRGLIQHLLRRFKGKWKTRGTCVAKTDALS
jgi:hypothetical protein